MLSRIHAYAASLGLLLAGPPIAMGQSTLVAMLDRANTAVLPSYGVKGFPITPHQFSVVGSAHVEEQSPSPSLVMVGMPASPHQIAVLTPRHGATAKVTAAKATNIGLAAQ
jgi:hypothetical protein